MKDIIDGIEYVYVKSTPAIPHHIRSTIDSILKEYHYMQGLRDKVRLKNEKYELMGYSNNGTMSVWIPTWAEAKRLGW